MEATGKTSTSPPWTNVFAVAVFFDYESHDRKRPEAAGGTRNHLDI